MQEHERNILYNILRDARIMSISIYSFFLHVKFPDIIYILLLSIEGKHTIQLNETTVWCACLPNFVVLFILSASVLMPTMYKNYSCNISFNSSSSFCNVFHFILYC
ncbi:hypothetical protein AMTRI_Chr07g76850 [Amborella trichopoda]